ncbi:MAG: lipoprotein insertase outer membrane protein LolB [Legionella sp.]|uniref:lipoprotein insertase outer membrane protein LolB n=1 Tax=Legionella sp. TaxID=459 RepID=UPI00283F4AA8|nr:lipoprotein insertase outer membrane protein LolB [Legionella sp.]
MDNLKRFIVLPIFLLTACAPPRPVMMPEQPNKIAKVAPNETPTEKQHAAGKAETVSSWEIRGALAAKNKSKGWSAAMNWTQNGPSSYQIRLMGPLGAGAVLINKKGSTITFQDGPKRVTSTNADELLLQQTGVRLPVSNLYYWVRGLPAPGKVGSEQRDAANHLVMLRQSGYTVTFGNYTTVKGVALPGIVRLDGNGVMVKVVIKNWSI